MTKDNLLTPLLVFAIFLTLFCGCMLGSTSMGVDRIIGGLTGTGSIGDQIVIWQIRLPRTLCAVVVGMALGASGAALQGLLRNPLAEPGVLGVTTCSSLAATFSIYYGMTAISPIALPIFSIVGALIATSILAFTAIRTQSVVTLILVGVGISSLSAAFMSLLMNMAPNPFALSDMINWMLGSVANRSMDDVLLSAPFMLLGFAILFLTRHGLSALTLGEEAASGLGLNLARQRLFVVVGAGLATGASVSIAGAIGFVGIVAPHLVRPFVQYDPARSILPSALLAGVFLAVADILIRIAPTQNELKLGVVAALIGAPAFIWIAIHRGRTND